MIRTDTSYILKPVLKFGPPLWSSGQSSCLQTQRSGSDSRHYQIFLRSSESGTGSTPVYKAENSDVGDLCADYATYVYLQKLALTSPTSGDRSVAIVRSRNKATEFFIRMYVLARIDYLWESQREGDH
jgi:hypothetical protein